MPQYYIETSRKKIYFVVDKLEGLVIKRNTDTMKELYDVLREMYVVDEIRTLLSEEGWFLMLELSDDHYGTPEYKIYS
jgi:hypothetical protein